MDLTYIPNIPFATHTPAQDQPNMQTNTNSIESIVSIDMIGFGNPNGGYHSKVTFIDQESAVPYPAPPPSPTAGVLYGNSTGDAPFPADANPELYYVNNSNTKKISGNILTASGALTPGGSYNVFTTPWNLRIFMGLTSSVGAGPTTFTMTGGPNLGAIVYTAQISTAFGVTSVMASVTPNASTNTFSIKTNGASSAQFYWLIISD